MNRIEKLWLIIDVSNMCYRALFSLGSVYKDGCALGVLHHVFERIIFLEELFDTDRIVFCFDGGVSKRREIYSGYKVYDRDKFDKFERFEDAKKAREDLYQLMYDLRTSYLPGIGFWNVFFQDGYEADDLIASVCEFVVESGDKAVIVSTDSDLWQLLSERIMIWNDRSHKTYTVKSFVERWGVSPSQWADVKALAGCASDRVPGIKGIGDITACKFLGGTLKSDTKKFKSIIDNRHIWDRNLKLVQLPFEGTMKCKLVDDYMSDMKWDAVMEKLGIKSSMMRGIRS